MSGNKRYYDGRSGASPSNGNYDDPGYQAGRRQRQLDQELASMSPGEIMDNLIGLFVGGILLTACLLLVVVWPSIESALNSTWIVVMKFSSLWAVALGAWAGTKSGEYASRVLFTLLAIFATIFMIVHGSVATLFAVLATFGVIWFLPSRHPRASLVVRLIVFAAVVLPLAFWSGRGFSGLVLSSSVWAIFFAGLSASLCFSSIGKATSGKTRLLIAASAATVFLLHLGFHI